MLERSIANTTSDLVRSIQDGEWSILVGDDAEALDKGVRSLPLGGMYPLTDNDGIGNLSLSLAQVGDPTYYPGRQTQLERRQKAKL